MRVAQVRYTMNDARLPSEQRRGQNRQRGIFRAAHLDRARERIAAVNKNLIHTWQTEIAFYLNNRFSNKCRGNFFPPMWKKALHSGPARFPRPASRPSAGVPAPAQSVSSLIRPPARRQKARRPDHVKPRAKAYVDLAPRYREDSQQ